MPPAIVDQAEESLEGMVQEIAIAILLRGQLGFGRIAQALKRVACAVLLALHWRVAKLLARLYVEEEEQAVEVAETFTRELLCQIFAIDTFFQNLPEIPDRFVAEQFDGFAGAILQVFRNGEGVFVRVFIQPVQKADLVSWTHGLAMKEGGHCPERGGLAATEDLLQIKAQQAL